MSLLLANIELVIILVMNCLCYNDGGIKVKSFYIIMKDTWLRFLWGNKSDVIKLLALAGILDIKLPLINCNPRDRLL